MNLMEKIYRIKTSTKLTAVPLVAHSSIQIFEATFADDGNHSVEITTMGGRCDNTMTTEEIEGFLRIWNEVL